MSLGMFALKEAPEYDAEERAHHNDQRLYLRSNVLIYAEHLHQPFSRTRYFGRSVATRPCVVSSILKQVKHREEQRAHEHDESDEVRHGRDVRAPRLGGGVHRRLRISTAELFA